MSSPFEQLAKDLPDGAFWPTGKFFKRLLGELTRDRAVAGSNIEEIPTTSGRSFIAKPGGVSAIVRQPFELVKVSDGEGEDKVFRVIGSTIDGPIPTFSGATADGADWLVDVSASGYLWARITLATATGEKTAVELQKGGSVPPADAGGVYSRLIGRYIVEGETLTVSNYRFGPVEADIFRDFYEATITFVLVWL